MLLILLAPALPTPLRGQEGAQEEVPRASGLTERSGSRLTQIDISVLGPPELASALTADDFYIKVNFRKLDAFTLDRMCHAPDDAPQTAALALAETAGSVRTVAGSPPTFMFYFDQPHLTLGGRQRGLSVARQLVGEIIREGSQAMVVSNADNLKIVAPLTTDTTLLLEALDRLEGDREQWDTYAAEEDSRVSQVVRILNEPRETAGVERAIGLARRFQMEETWRAEKSMRRLGMTLKRLSEVTPPKAVILFADTLRSNAGEHYLSFFGENLRQSQAELSSINSEAQMAQLSFDGVVNEAALQGIRFYPVLSEGLTSNFTSAVPTAAAFNATSANPSGSRARFSQAQNTLASLGTETGGYAFLTGQRPSRMAERLASDFSCMYIASFDPSDFPEDQPLRVVVETHREGVELRTRGRVVVESPSARATSRLLSAFASPEGDTGDPLAVRATLVPTGFVGGSYTALLQISVPATPLQSATWDLGASVIARDKVARETSGRLTVSRPGVPVVFETELRFKPGTYSIVSVAHETATGLISSDRFEVTWPEPKLLATLSPIAVLQPTDGAFLRSADSRTSGSLAQGRHQPILTDRPTALVGLVCRSKKNERSLEVRRSLVGASTVDFPPLAIDLGDERCAQIRDLVPENTMGAGYYRYDIHVTAGGDTVSTESRDFFAVAPQR